MVKSTSLKLYDEANLHKFTISSTVQNQKISHPENVKFTNTLSVSHTDASETSNDFGDIVQTVRGEDTNHTFVSGLLDGRIANTETLVADEGIAYLAHKASIENALSTEEARSIAATDALGLSANQTTIDRINQTSTIDGKILSAIADRQAGVTAYNTYVQDGVQEIQTEKASGDLAITQRIDNLMSIGQVSATKLMDIVSEFQQADTAQLAEIAQIQADYDVLKQRIDDVIVQETGSSSSQTTFDVKVSGTHYAGSTLLKIRLLEPDAQLMYDTLQQGDQLKITFDSGGEETVVFDSFSNYLPDNYYYLNVQSPVTLHYFQPDVIIEVL